jgi:hypothetical protein
MKRSICRSGMSTISWTRARCGSSRLNSKQFSKVPPEFGDQYAEILDALNNHLVA